MDAFVDALGGMAVPVPVVVDSGGGVYSQSPQPNRERDLHDLSGGAYRQSNPKLD